MPVRLLRGRHSGFLILDHPNDLRLGETALSHLSALQRWCRLYITVRELAGEGRSVPIRLIDLHICISFSLRFRF